MARPRRLGGAVVDTSVVIRAARAFRQQPAAPDTPELQLLLAWRDDPDVFIWMFSEQILMEYREVMERLRVPRNATGRFINLLREAGEEVTSLVSGEFSPDAKDDPFYHCALGGDANYIITNNVRDFLPIPGRKRPRIITPANAVQRLAL